MSVSKRKRATRSEGNAEVIAMTAALVAKNARFEMMRKQVALATPSINTYRGKDGFCEISFAVPAVVEGAFPIVVAIVSHPCKGGKWIVHSNTQSRVLVSPIKRRAMACALALAESYEASVSHLRKHEVRS